MARETLEEKLAVAKTKHAEAEAVCDAFLASREYVAAQAAQAAATERRAELRSTHHERVRDVVALRFGAKPGTKSYTNRVRALATKWLGLTAADIAAGATMHGDTDLLTNAVAALGSALSKSLVANDPSVKKLVQQVAAAEKAKDACRDARWLLEREHSPPLRVMQNAVLYAHRDIHDLQDKIRTRDDRRAAKIAKAREAGVPDSAAEPSKAQLTQYKEARKRLRDITGFGKERGFGYHNTGRKGGAAKQLNAFVAFVKRSVAK